MGGIFLSPFLRRCEPCLPAALFLAAWGVYAAGAGPSLYGGDSGELIASAAALGVSHAPGYPLHALLGRLFIEAVPWGAIPYRVNLLSAFVSALTAALLFRLLRRLLDSPPAALAGAALYALLPVVRDQAMTAEVFALNNLAAVLLLLCFVEGLPPGPASPFRERSLCAWAFLYGLGLANHHTLVLIFPVFLLLFWRALREPSRGFSSNLRRAAQELGRRAPAWGLFFLLGFSLYLYLPLRAARHPPVNFGDPHTVRRFWDVLTRKEFGRLELHPASVPFHTADLFQQQVRAFVRRHFSQTGAGASALGLAGLLLMWRRRDPAGGAWLLAWALAGPFFSLFSNLSPFNTLAQWRMERFLLLPALFCAAGVGVCFRALVSRRRHGAALVLLAALAVEQVFFTPRPWFRWNLAFQDFGRNLCASLPPRSLLLIDRLLFDEPTSCLLNQMTARRQRTDLRPIYRPGTLFELFYGEDVLEIPRQDRLTRQEEREEILWKRLDRPLAALAFVKENLPPFPWTLRGYVYRREAAPVSPEPFYVGRGEGRPPDYPTRLIRVHDPYFRAKAALEADDLDGAARAAQEASSLGRDMEWLQSNLGSLWSRWSARTAAGAGSEKSLSLAARAFERAVAVDPYFPPAQFGLGYVRFREAKHLEAIQAFSEAARLRPDWPEAHYMLGLAYRVAGSPQGAAGPWRRFLSLDPRSPLAPEVRRALKEDRAG